MRGPALLIILIVLLGGGWLLGTGYIAPIRLSVLQEQIVGLTHGGIVGSDEEVLVDNCVQVGGREGLWNITRRHRIVFFADGSRLEFIYSSPPSENANC
jgi:hypothetical protein